jgi:hypothetical protein
VCCKIAEKKEFSSFFFPTKSRQYLLGFKLNGTFSFLLKSSQWFYYLWQTMTIRCRRRSRVAGWYIFLTKDTKLGKSG